MPSRPDLPASSKPDDETPASEGLPAGAPPLDYSVHRPASPPPGPGERLSTSELFPMVYDEMRALAQKRLEKLPPGQTLQATALVNEVFLKLSRNAQDGWEHRRHLYAAAARAMREVLVDIAKRKGAAIHGGDMRRINLEDDLRSTPERDWTDELIDLDNALRRLELAGDERVQIVMLKYFAGLTFEQIGQCLNMSSKTAERKWKFTQAWLHREMRHPRSALPIG